MFVSTIVDTRTVRIVIMVSIKNYKPLFILETCANGDCAAALRIALMTADTNEDPFFGDGDRLLLSGLPSALLLLLLYASLWNITSWNDKIYIYLRSTLHSYKQIVSTDL